MQKNTAKKEKAGDWGIQSTSETCRMCTLKHLSSQTYPETVIFRRDKNDKYIKTRTKIIS